MNRESSASRVRGQCDRSGGWRRTRESAPDSELGIMMSIYECGQRTSAKAIRYDTGNRRNVLRVSRRRARHVTRITARKRGPGGKKINIFLQRRMSRKFGLDGRSKASAQCEH